jgi:uncharacterized protein YjbI with pentapeptide repeats
VHKFYIELAVGLLAVVAGIYAKEKPEAMNWLWRTLASVAERYTSWLCLGLASVSFGLAFHEWMKVDGRHKWKRMTWSVVLTVVLLISSWFLIGWLNLTKVDRFQIDENWAQRDLLRQQLQGGQPEEAFLEGEDIHETMLAGVCLKKAKLKGANLRKAMLAGADLGQANLDYADLQGAMLLGANLRGASLLNANLEGAMMLGAQLEGAQIDGANFKDAVVSQDQVNEACGKPIILPEGLTLPSPC